MSALDQALREAVRAELATAIDQLAEMVAAQPVRKFVDGAGLGLALDVSAPIVTRLVREGMPHIMIGACRRFDVAECVAWLRSRSSANDGADAEAS